MATRCAQIQSLKECDYHEELGFLHWMYDTFHELRPNSLPGFIKACLVRDRLQYIKHSEQ